MSKAVLISIKPEWCELIANGNKTIEVRKTRPKLETPFKCYIYCTLPKRSGDIFLIGCEKPLQGNGKVIGEFICDWITGVKCDNAGQAAYNRHHNTCLTDEQIMKYANNGKLYYWHISGLVIYDKPKELSEFEKPCPYDEDCWKCKFYDGGSREEPPSCNWEDFELTKPPQSWCYVEARKNNAE